VSGVADLLGQGPRVVEARLPKRGREDEAREYEDLRAAVLQLTILGALPEATRRRWDEARQAAETDPPFHVVAVRGLPPADLERLTAAHVNRDTGDVDWTALLPPVMAVSAVEEAWRDATAWRQVIASGDVDTGAMQTLRRAIEAANLNAGGLSPLGDSAATTS